MAVKGSACEFLSTKSMHILKRGMDRLILHGKYCCNIGKTWVPITFFLCH